MAKLMNLTESAAKIGICKSTLSRWVSDGKTPEPMQIGNQLVFSADDVRKMKQTHQNKKSG